jgi:hypothetical protein
VSPSASGAVGWLKVRARLLPFAVLTYRLDEMDPSGQCPSCCRCGCGRWRGVECRRRRGLGPRPSWRTAIALFRRRAGEQSFACGTSAPVVGCCDCLSGLARLRLIPMLPSLLRFVAMQQLRPASGTRGHDRGRLAARSSARAGGVCRQGASVMWLPSDGPTTRHARRPPSRPGLATCRAARSPLLRRRARLPEPSRRRASAPRLLGQEHRSECRARA